MNLANPGTPCEDMPVNNCSRRRNNCCLVLEEVRQPTLCRSVSLRNWMMRKGSSLCLWQAPHRRNAVSRRSPQRCSGRRRSAPLHRLDLRGTNRLLHSPGEHMRELQHVLEALQWIFCQCLLHHLFNFLGNNPSPTGERCRSHHMMLPEDFLRCSGKWWVAAEPLVSNDCK